MLVGSGRECCHATDVDEIECGVDLYSARIVVFCDKYAVNIGGAEMGHEMERRTRGKATEKEVGETPGGRTCRGNGGDRGH